MVAVVVVVGVILAYLPRLFAAAHSLKERQERGYAERRCDDGKGARGCVAHVLVDVVNVGTHGRDHRGQARSLGQVGDDLASWRPNTHSESSNTHSESSYTVQ